MNSKKWVITIAALVLLASFFLPWVAWNGIKVSGHALAGGSFFSLSEAQLGLVNPFPKISFLFFVFWLIPVLSLVIIYLVWTKKKTDWALLTAGFLSLSLLTLYYRFSDFGLGKAPWSVLGIGAWLQLMASLVLILASGTSLLKKVLWIVAGPVIVLGVFAITEKYIMGETHSETFDVKADYTLGVNDLVNEFKSSDNSANNKYFEKVLQVNGQATAITLLSDSSSTIRFGDSTSSYAIFSLEKSELNEVVKIKPGDAVSLKGVCSGSIYSEILSTLSITFKRSILVKK